MFQIIESITDTCVRLGERYGPMVALAVLVVAGGGVALHVLRRVLSGGGVKTG